MMEGTSITDLSDPLRPQKVSEMFNELYDNQWTEAFESLTSEAKTADDRCQRVITKRLLDTLMNCYDFCSKEAEMQRKGFVASLTLSYKEGDGANVLTCDTRKQLINFIKNVAPEVVTFLKNKYPSREQPRALQSYEDRCLECCWYACIQSPPLHLRTDFTMFDENCHKGYQTSGSLVDYVVWPGIYIESNGALLSKAVVEGCNERKTSLQVATNKSVSGNTVSSQEQELIDNNNFANTFSTSENECVGIHVARIQIGSNNTETESANTVAHHATNPNSAVSGAFVLTAAELESKRSELKETKTNDTKTEPKTAKKELTNLIERSLSSQEPTLQRTPSAILDVSPEELEDRKSTLKEIKTPDTRQQPKEIGSFNFG